jgi:uncharacterized LabA/DUF88 family protein
MSLDILDRLDQVSGIVIFSGDSDFAEVIKRAKVKNKRIYLFGVRNSVAKELWELIDVYIDFGLWFNGIRKRSQNNINKMQKSPNKGGLRDISEKI